MTEPIRIPFSVRSEHVSGDIYRSVPVGIDITPEIARQIVGMGQKAIMEAGPPQQDAKPDADEAAKWLVATFDFDYGIANGVIADIRAGKVPGVWCGELAENIASAQLVAALRRENEALKAKLGVAEEANCLYDEEARSARTKLKEVANATLVECVPLDGGITNAFHVLRERIGELEGQLEGERCYSAQSRKERDKALADLAAMTERAEKAEALAAMRLAGYNDLLAAYNKSMSWHAEQRDAARADADALAEALRCAVRARVVPGAWDGALLKQIDATLAAHDARRASNLAGQPPRVAAPQPQADPVAGSAAPAAVGCELSNGETK